MKSMIRKKILNLREWQSKAALYCAANESCRQSIRRKMDAWGTSRDMMDDVIEWLCSENYINEERFAHAYVESKIRYQHWGRQKIKMQLQSKAIDPEVIQRAMSQIDEELYDAMLLRVAREKLRIMALPLDEVSIKLNVFLQSRGFESHKVAEALRQLKAENLDNVSIE